MTTEHEHAIGWVAGILLLIIDAWLIIRGGKR